MTYYPPKIAERFHAAARRSAGRARGANGTGTAAAFSCGSVLRFTLRIDGEAMEIAEARFRTSGCGYAVAAADALARRVAGKRLAELHGLDENALRRGVEAELGPFGEDRAHCVGLAIEALRGAFADYRAARLEEWSGEKALVCTCFGVAEETVERAIEKDALETVEEVTAACRAGGGCGSCQPLIEDILDSFWRGRRV